MARSPRHRIAELLAGTASKVPASVEETAPPEDLMIDVRDIGPIALPITATQAKKLRLISRRAPYGLGEDTLVDRTVRDAWQVPRSRIKIGKRRWNRTLNPTLERIQDGLGLPASCRLKAELNSMLVYEPGGFFAHHQDSEKHDDMIGSLVVMLPSNATGGELVVGRGNDLVAHSGSRTALRMVAFYSDTIHEVRPVNTGYRVVLTYDLLVTATGNQTTATIAAGAPVEELTGLLNQHFSSPADVPSWMRDRGPAEPPDRLVYLLDHEYTERGLGWSSLKGSDGTRAATLRAAADNADCETALAVADVHETWDAQEEEWGRNRRSSSRRTGYNDDRVDHLDLDGYELHELIDSSVEVHPITGSSMQSDVDGSELCESTPSIALAPYESEYEGYMGNYGNTMDRWYRRAAVVVWPKNRGFIIRSKGDPARALQELDALFEDDPDTARSNLAALMPFWSETVGRSVGRDAIGTALAVARKADDAELAAALLEPFTALDLVPDDAPVLMAAVDHYGIDWARPWLTRWAEPEVAYRPVPLAGGAISPQQWVEALAAMAAAIVAEARPLESSAESLAEAESRSDAPAQSTAMAVAGAVVGAGATWLRRSLARAAAVTAPSQRETQLAGLGPGLRSLLVAADVADLPRVTSKMVDHVSGAESDPNLLPCLLSAVLDDDVRPSSVNGLDAVARFCETQLAHHLARPPREGDNWAIDLPTPWCGCNDCETLVEFLLDRNRRELEWPLAKPRRQHIHQVIDGAEMPVRHITKRTGSPHKLMLTKTAELFDREQRIRDRYQADLALVRAVL